MTPPDERPGDGEFVPREEYERRHKLLRRRYETFATRTLRILKVLVVVLILNGAFSAYLLDQNSTRVEENTAFNAELQKAAIKSCEDNGNPLREAARKFGRTLEGQIRADLDQSAQLERSGAYAKLFPGFDQRELGELLDAQRERGLDEIAELQSAVAGIARVDCAKAYSKPPDPVG